MASMWGSGKKNSNSPDNEVPANDTHDRGEESQPSREPDERTRLLPSRGRPTAEGYLDPDDPAVSPYNLWSVRFVRYLTVLFTFISALWWLLLLISIFVSPPGMHSRGSGFFDFSYTCLTLGNLLVALLFFSSPSKAMRICTAAMAVLLLVDMIVILTVPILRIEEGWVGIASVVWATTVAMWCILTDRIVAWGKREEEERLTGRPETRRTLAEWFAVLFATLVLILFIIVSILMTATLVLRARDASLPMNGERYYVDGNKYQVHLNCIGNFTDDPPKDVPTMILEAGYEPSEHELELWANTVWQNGTIARYCYWDRPGIAWSDNAPSPHSAGMSADALSEALAQAGEEGPWILVSAGVGSITSRIFSSRHNRAVVGMMLLDPLHEDLLYQLSSPSRGFLLWCWGIISPLGISRLAGAIFQGRSREDRVYGRDANQSGKFIKAQLQDSLVADSLSKSEVSSARNIQSRDTPLVVVSSGILCQSNDQWNKKQKDLTKLTDRLVGWDVVRKAPHQIWRTTRGRTVMEERLKELVKLWESSK